MKLYSDDGEILRLAFVDGCRDLLIDARRKTNASAFLVWPRAYVVHTADGDSGFSCLEARDLSEWLELIDWLPRILGPLAGARLAPNENAAPDKAH